MGFLLSKVLTLLASPVGITLLICSLALVASYFYREELSRRLLAIAIIWCWLSATPIFAGWVYGPLERAYESTTVDKLPQADAIVVLGGGVQPVSPPRSHPGFNLAGDRIVHGFRLYKQGIADKIILTGGQVFPVDTLESEAFYMKVLLKEWGVPDEAIIMEDGSRTTYENATKTKEIVDQLNLSKLVLVTSAAHMPRSVCAFEKAGMEVTPAPTDYEVTGTPQKFILSIMPSSGAQDLVSRGMKEYLGRLVYYIRGQC